MGSSGQDSTLIVMNAPNNGFQHVKLWKRWFKYDSSGALIQASSDEVKKYAIGLQVYQRFNVDGSSWVPFANPFYVAVSRDVIDCDGNSYINEDNPFKFEYVKAENDIWKWQFLQYDGIKNGFPKYGLLNGEKKEYVYEVREIGVYTGNHASTVDELTRVYDYANTTNWEFDETHKDAESYSKANGINVEAGKLKVTKAWEGGHVGSRIYFEVYRGNENITSSIVEDPESYGLTVHQVYKDDTHTALIVTSNGTDWTPIEIQGLPIGPSGGGTRYSYAIKEIGYSEADGTNCWDGEIIKNADGSDRKDPYGNSVTAEITGESGLLTGYQIDSSGASKTAENKSASVNVNQEHTITVNNKYVEKYTDLSITKVWTNQAGTFLTWPSDVQTITVDLYAGEEKFAEGIQLFLTPPKIEGTEDYMTESFRQIGTTKPTYTWTRSIDKSGTQYTFTFPNLPALSDGTVYSVRETPPGDYQVSYGALGDREIEIPKLDANGDPIMSDGQFVMQTVTETVFQENLTAQGAADGHVIRNMKTESGVELPHAGGPGARTLALTGAALAASAALGLAWKRKALP